MTNRLRTTLIVGLNLTVLFHGLALGQEEVAESPIRASKSQSTTDDVGAQWLALIDVNHDGRIGPDEVFSSPATKLAKEVKRHDANSDGYVDAAELKQPWGVPLPPPAVIARLDTAKKFLASDDTNHDGRIGRDEVASAALKGRFESIDKNGDDRLNLHELYSYVRANPDIGSNNRLDARTSNAQSLPSRRGPARNRAGASEASWRQHFGEGIRLLNDGKVDEAKRAFAEAAKRLASIPEENRGIVVWGYLGQALYRAGDYQQARMAIEKCNEMRGDKEPTAAYGPRWWYYAMILAHTGDTAKARQYYDVMFAEIKSNRSLQWFNDKYRLELAGILGIETKPLPGAAGSQPPRDPGQRNDPDFRPAVANPQFTESNAPTVAIDQGHRNFHTKDGRFLPFAEVLEADGCQVVAHAGAFSEASLAKVDILVIANALPGRIQGAEIGSAFTKQEIDLLKNWVRGGGSLMLLADHRPYGEAAKQLGEAFGVEMSGGFVLEDGRDRGRIVFSRDNGRLADHPISKGLSHDQPVTSITSFTGQALRLPAEFTPLMSFVKDAKRYADRRNGTGRDAEDVSQWHQGAVAEIGEGRIAVFGEAGMFSAQVARRGMKMGMSAAGAEQNQQFLLNVVRWLARSI